MSLSQPSRTIVVEPVRAATAAPAPAEPAQVKPTSRDDTLREPVQIPARS
jgi:hypothetical protein